MANVIIRIDEKLKKQTKSILEKQGLDMSTAIKMFFSQIVIEKGLPFLPTHNQEILKKRWDAQVEDAIKTGKAYSSVQELFTDIN